MKKRLLLEYIIAYILLGVLGFLTITFVGSMLIENYLEEIVARNLNLEAESIAANYHLMQNWENGSYDTLVEDLKTVANYEEASIWVVNADNTIDVAIPDTEIKEFPSQFSIEKWKNGEHSIGKFYGYFPDDRLTVFAPIKAEGISQSGYIFLHYQMQRLHVRRSGALLITQILFVIMYLFSYVLVALFYYRIHKPLQDIAKGASAYAHGDLSYRIPVNSNDEIGYVAKTLNYMSDVLNQNGNYQKEFVSNVSHDFRSPLTSIKGYVNAILDGTIPPEYQEKYLGIIAAETDRLEQLTKSLLALNDLDSKKRTLKMSRFDIHHTILSLMETYEGRCEERKIQIDLELEGKELYVQADEQQIQQVLYNLLDNAIKFSPEKSTIVLGTSKKGNRVFVSVKDHGCGIPKDSLQKIWSRFYKTDSSRGKDRKGTGLGLSIVREIINAHDQQIDVISTEGAGTEFIFTLEKG